MNVKEHELNSSVKRLEILEVLSKGHELRKLGKVVQTRNQLLCVPDTPLGLHLSVHDADQSYPRARIHQRIPQGKGVFRVYPLGSAIGNIICQVDIPPFSDIKGILRLPPEPSGVKLGPILLRADDLWQQSHLLKPCEVKSGFIVNIDLDRTSGNGVGIEYFFLEPGSLAPLIGWYADSDRARMYMWMELVVEVFKAFVPWLVIVTLRGSFKE